MTLRLVNDIIRIVANPISNINKNFLRKIKGKIKENYFLH